MRVTRVAVVLPSIASVVASVGAMTAMAADAPRLGFRGTVVDLKADAGVPAPEGVPNRGLRVQSVQANTPAARMGFEPGDIIVSIDSMRFTTLNGYFHALNCSGQRPSIVLINVRNGQFVRRSTSLTHAIPPDDQCGPQPPDSYWMSIDLESDFRR